MEMIFLLDNPPKIPYDKDYTKGREQEEYSGIPVRENRSPAERRFWGSHWKVAWEPGV